MCSWFYWNFIHKSCLLCRNFISIYKINRTSHGPLGIQILSSRAEIISHSFTLVIHERYFQHSKIKFVSPCGHAEKYRAESISHLFALLTHEILSVLEDKIPIPRGHVMSSIYKNNVKTSPCWGGGGKWCEQGWKKPHIPVHSHASKNVKIMDKKEC